MKNTSMNRKITVSVIGMMLLVLSVSLTSLFLVGCGDEEEPSLVEGDEEGNGEQEVSSAEEISPMADVPAVPDEVRCVVGLTLKIGESCSYVGGGNNFTFNVRDDGLGCVGGLCSGNSVQINRFSASKNPDGSWTINGLP